VVCGARVGLTNDRSTNTHTDNPHCPSTDNQPTVETTIPMCKTFGYAQLPKACSADR